jgi:uncharacterized protein
LGPDTNRKPVPQPDELTRFYWDGARRGQLLIQRCGDCGLFLFPPGVVCPRCLSETLTATPVSGRGTIYAFTVAQQAFDIAFADDIPYVLAIVELEEQEHLRILTNIVGAEANTLSSGQAVEVVFEDRRGFALPQFRPAGEGT